jgi:hypothetical protein
MPFVTEELWQHIAERKEGESLMLSLLEESKPYDEKILAEVDLAREVVSGIRNIRAQKNIPNKEKVRYTLVLCYISAIACHPGGRYRHRPLCNIIRRIPKPTTQHLTIEIIAPLSA